MRRSWIISFIIIATILSGCGIKVVDDLNKVGEKEAVSNLPNTSDTLYNLSSAIVKPVSNASVDWECGTYYSDISKENMNRYLQALLEDGWQDMQGETVPTEIIQGTSEYMLTKGDNLLQIMTFLMDSEHSISNSLLVKADTNISISGIKNREEALTKREALEQIKSNIKYSVEQGEVPVAKGNVTGVIELFIDKAYEYMGIQAYAAVSDYGLAGCFLIRKGVVSFVQGSLNNSCVVDIDEDGSFELVDLFTTWSTGVHRIEIYAYEYVQPIFFSSLTEILHKKYYNCFVPEEGYAILQLIKVDDTTVKLAGENVVYGPILIDGTTLVVENMEAFPFVEWSVAYDQSLLIQIDKEIPNTPPEITIDIDGLSQDYVVEATKWGSNQSELTATDYFRKVLEKDTFIPTYQHGGIGGMDTSAGRAITINFGNSIPNSIQVYDAMMDEKGNVRYGDKLILEQTVKILDNSRVQFNLGQHMAFYLSSNSRDYERNWYRLFRIVCNWSGNECTYAFLINTGLVESLTKISDNQFLNCEGGFSRLSSSWGLGLTIDAEKLPKHYVVEWQISDGLIRTWSEKGLKPFAITNQHNGYPMTYSDDGNDGSVIWSPLSFDKKEDVTVTAYIYETAEDKSPIAFSSITLDNNSGAYQKK